MTRPVPALALAAPLLLLAACGGGATRPDITWRGAPSGPPGALARTDDQAEARLEPLARPTPTATPSAGATRELNRAAELSATSARRYAEGDVAGAIADQQAALDIRERVLGAGHLDVAATLTSLAQLYAVNGEEAAAEPLLQRALAIREAATGPRSLLVAESLSNLGLFYAAAGRYADAEPYYQRAIDLLEGDAAARAPLAVVLDNYAALLADSGRPEGAKALEARARALRAEADLPAATPTATALPR